MKWPFNLKPKLAKHEPERFAPLYMFAPGEDISAAELATILMDNNGSLQDNNGSLQFEEHTFKSLPVVCQRHFNVIKFVRKISL